MEYTCTHNHQSQFIEWFGNAIQSVPLEDVVEILDNKRKPLNDSQRSGMKSGQLYPYYGATGVVDYVNAFLTDEDLICLAEDCGAYGPGEQSSYIIEGKAWVNNHAHVLRAKDNVILKYLQFFFTLTDLNEFISGTTRKKLTQSALKKIKVTLPDIELQELFVAIAEQADKSKFDGFKSQFIEWFGNVTETTSLSSLIAESYPGEWGKEAKNNNGVKVLRTTNFQNNGHIDYSDVIVRYIEQKKIEKKCLRTGDIILERSGGTKDNPVGRVVLFEAEGEYMFNNFTQLLRPIKSVNPYYLFFYLHTSYNADKASMRAMASQTTGIQNLNMTDYMAKEIPLPSLEEQEQFERLYRQADKSKYYEINET